MENLNTKRIGIFLFNQVEVLDFAGPYEVFTTASRVFQRQYPTQPLPFEVVTIAQTLEPIQARAGLVVQPNYVINQHPMLDVLIVPGGVVTAEMRKPEVIAWIQKTDISSQITASICTGAFLLAQADLLDGKTVTTHWEDITDLRQQFPGLNVKENCRWVDEGKIVTSAGISAGIDMSLHLVARLAGETLAIATARQMEFDWTKA